MVRGAYISIPHTRRPPRPARRPLNWSFHHVRASQAISRHPIVKRYAARGLRHLRTATLSLFLLRRALRHAGRGSGDADPLAECCVRGAGRRSRGKLSTTGSNPGSAGQRGSGRRKRMPHRGCGPRAWSAGRGLLSWRLSLWLLRLAFLRIGRHRHRDRWAPLWGRPFRRRTHRWRTHRRRTHRRRTRWRAWRRASLIRGAIHRERCARKHFEPKSETPKPKTEPLRCLPEGGRAGAIERAIAPARSNAGEAGWGSGSSSSWISSVISASRC